MFAITERLLLRPGWIEDAAELTAAIADEGIVRNLASAPWPYTIADAEEFLSSSPETLFPKFLITDRVDDPGRIIGVIGIDEIQGNDAVDLGYWLARDYWSRGLMTEAGNAVLDNARVALRHRKIVAGHFVDNPASGRVLEKLGFRKTGRTEPRSSRGRGHDVDCALYELDGEADLEYEIPRMLQAIAA